MLPGYNETICFMSSDPYSVLKKDILIHCCSLYMVSGWSNNFKMLVIFWRMISIFLKKENINGHFWHICLSHIYDTCVINEREISYKDLLCGFGHGWPRIFSVEHTCL